jgi:hypothetical protein
LNITDPVNSHIAPVVLKLKGHFGVRWHRLTLIHHFAAFIIGFGLN